MDLKSHKELSSGVYFFVQRGNGRTSKDGVIRFHKEHLNIGKGMNISTGVFTAPKSGIYHVSLSISKDGFSYITLHIYLRVNGVKMGKAVTGSGLHTAPTTFQSTLNLRKGDRVDVWKPESGTLGDCSMFGEFGNIEPPCHHFTGWLLEEYSNQLL